MELDGWIVDIQAIFQLSVHFRYTATHWWRIHDYSHFHGCGATLLMSLRKGSGGQIPRASRLWLTSYLKYFTWCSNIILFDLNVYTSKTLLYSDYSSSNSIPLLVFLPNSCSQGPCRPPELTAQTQAAPTLRHLLSQSRIPMPWAFRRECHHSQLCHLLRGRRSRIWTGLYCPSPL